MVLYPAVQRMAQEEMDRVIGSDRLPEWEDRSQLPYLRGCVQETLRCEIDVFMYICDDRLMLGRGSNYFDWRTDAACHVQGG